MPVLFCDLDDTLIDRAGAFRRWAQRFLDNRGDDPRLLDKVIQADGDGLRPKPEVAAQLRTLLALSDGDHERIITTMRAGVVQELVPDDDVVRSLRAARALGWDVVIVTNGVTEQQERKITMLGLDDEVDAWVVSGAEGVAKPDPEIFRAGARAAGSDDLTGAWMIGDAPETDILGAVNAGISSVWLHRGRPYPEGVPAPTARAASFPDAVEIVLSRS